MAAAAVVAVAVVLVAVGTGGGSDDQASSTPASPDVRITTPRAGASLPALPLFRGRGRTGSGTAGVELAIYRGRRVAGRPLSAGVPARRADDGTWTARRVLGRGTYTAVASQDIPTGTATSRPVTFTITVDPVIAAAGDIACDPNGTLDEDAKRDPCRQRRTSDLLAGDRKLSAVIPLGDLQYQDGLPRKYLAPGAYDDTWGRVKDITYPVIGHHEFSARNNKAIGYYDYFNGVGRRTGPAGRRPVVGDFGGYWSTEIGDWHVVALNSDCTLFSGQYSCARSAQLRWLKRDLARQPPGKCILAAFHEPRFSTADVGDTPKVGVFWKVLYAHHAAVVLNGHAHVYEDFRPQTPGGRLSRRRGIQQFVVGTGGVGHALFTHPRRRTLRTRQDDAYGVLRMTLRKDSYEWHFQRAKGEPSYKDDGRRRCP
jgi:hypothetical protein